MVDDLVIEIRDRCRRIETRLTKLMLEMGHETERQKPVFVPAQPDVSACISLPSHDASVRDSLRAIPPGWTGELRFVVGRDTLAVIDVHRVSGAYNQL